MARSTLIGLSTLKSLVASAALVFAATFGTTSFVNAAQPAFAPAPAAHSVGRMLPAPPPPPSATLPTKGSLTLSAASRVKSTPQPAATPSNQYLGAPGANPNQNTLVLYDTTGAWGWLGEAYGVQAGNLVSHGSKYTLQPAVNYTSGELAGYTGLIYIGSTYGEPLPTALLDDILATTKPVLWMNDNIWQLAARASNFTGQYGWTPGYFDFGNTLSVTYKGVTLTRDPLAVPSGLLETVISDPTKAQAIATGTASDTGVVSNWATRSGNLTYIGEVPFSYIGMSDRYLAAVDMVGNVSNPTMQARKRALVRIEDVNSEDDPNSLRAIADYLYSMHVPFSVAVIPLYLDPNGYYNNGVPMSVPLNQASGVVKALKYMESKGGTLIMHGYTHQYSNVDNPYSGVSADDFEFYLSHISSTNYVIYDSPPPQDTGLWASGRISSGRAIFAKAGLPTPTIFEPPHYAASAVDYQVFQQMFGTRYDRGLYAIGWCPNGVCGTGTPDYTRIYGQFFPYLVRDIYGSNVIPENLGNVELLASNHNPPRFPADILASAQCNTVITDGVMSFFFHPYLDISYLKQIVTGLQAMGYTFVPASTIKQG